jgi:hypothetical protein
MIDALRWIVCLVLGVPSGLLILANWGTVVSAMVTAARGGKGTFSFCPPVVCGIAGGVACLVCPLPEAWHWAWLPPLLDPSILIWPMLVVLLMIGRICGLPSPFDPQPAMPPGDRESANKGSA